MIKTLESATTRVMMLTWEYPPKRLGNISDHVQALSHELVKRGHEVEVLTEDDLKTGVEDISGRGEGAMVEEEDTKAYF